MKKILLFVLLSLFGVEAYSQNPVVFYLFARKSTTPVSIPATMMRRYADADGCQSWTEYAIRVGSSNFQSGYSFTPSTVGTFDFDFYTRAGGQVPDGFGWGGCVPVTATGWNASNGTQKVRIIVEDLTVVPIPKQCIPASGTTTLNIKPNLTGYNTSSSTYHNFDPYRAYVYNEAQANFTFNFPVDANGFLQTFSFSSPMTGTFQVNRSVKQQFNSATDTRNSYINGPWEVPYTYAALPKDLASSLPLNICADATPVNLTQAFTHNIPTGAVESFSCVGGNCGGSMFYTSSGDTFFRPDWNGTSSSYSSTIRYTVTTSDGCSSSFDQAVQIGSAFTLDAGTNVPVCKNGSNVNLATGATNNASGSPTVSWSGTAVTGSTFNTNDVAAVAGNTYTMTYTVNNNTGCTKTDTKDVIVNVVPNVPTISPTTPVICSGNDIILTASGASGAEYRWYSSADAYLNVTNANYTTPTLASTTTFKASSRIAATGCESAKQSKVVTVNPTPAQPTGVLTSPTSPACGSTNFTLTGQGSVAGEEYRWFNSSDALQGTGTNFATGVLNIGNYTFKVTRRNTTTGCESSLRSVPLSVINAPTINSASTSADLCSGTGTVNLNTLFGVSPTTGSWSSSNGTISSKLSGAGNATLNLSSISAATYPVRYTLVDGCTATKDFSLIFSTGAVSPIVNDDKLCQPGIANLQVQSPNGSYQYRWYTASSGGTLVNTGTSFTTPFLNSSTTYYIEAENTASGCVSGRDAALVTVVNIGTVNAGDDIGFCSNSGVSVNLAADASPAGGVFSGPGVTGSTFNGNALANNASYEITYTVTNNGCVKTDTRLISLGFNVILTYEPSTTVYPGELVKISHNYPTAAVTTWGFGDGQSLTHLNGNHYYYQEGKKTITVYIKQSGGCENTFTFPDAIEVLPAPIITQVEDPFTGIQIFPNPFITKVNISSQLLIGNATLKLYDLRGSVLYNSVVTIDNGNNSVMESIVPTLPVGMYILSIEKGSSKRLVKLIKK